MIKSANTLVETLMLIKEQPTEKTLNSKLLNWFRALTMKLRDDYCTFYKSRSQNICENFKLVSTSVNTECI